MPHKPHKPQAEKTRVTIYLSREADARLRQLEELLRDHRIETITRNGDVQQRAPSASSIVDRAILALTDAGARRLFD